MQIPAIPRILRQGLVGVQAHAAVTGKVLCHRGHAGAAHAPDECRGQSGDGPGGVRQGAVADHRAQAVVDVDHRPQPEVHARAEQLCRAEPAKLLGDGLRLRGFALP
ncbi:hypothetical protein KBTX_04348 [wastewater metagenome]|uniref:Uncharacterized protein n=2 Tax=unclassified sequences TaxID=12908 RepID=A0A5B8RJT6_9ZZZZ|nr:hypothetical protein KBTEX_04348 [uncultured organism]